MDGFVFPGPVWFLAPKPPFHSLLELCLTVLTGGFEDKASGEVEVGIFAFSDEDLAKRYLERGGPQASAYFPYSMSDAETIQFLEAMKRRGHRILGADAESGSYHRLPVDYVIGQLQSRQPEQG